MGTAVAAEPAPSRGQTVAKGTPVNRPGSEDPNVPVGGPAPDWFKDSAYRPEQPIPTDQDGEGEGTDPNISVGGPAPDWFKDPSFLPTEPMPEVEVPKSTKSGNLVSEPFVPMPYCRDVYGHYYWMSTSANVPSCTQGYVKYYDSRNGDYLAFYDVYRQYWNMTRSTALTTAYNWCTSNFICSIALEAFLVSKVKPAWQLIRAVRWGI
ncbi:hypothetical protein [Intrasporangium calvum]|uniref:hypothetical protein n=1 Tax=Intrasporangium calvum TaxID=53358 RepID=UPI0012373253|nr:hypothetical protein [Intrasporangium calvum]